MSAEPGAESPSAPPVLSLRTADLDEARWMLGQAFYVTHIDRLRPSDDVGAHLDVVRLGAVTVGEVGFGTDLRLRSGELGSYHVDVPLSGSIQWRQGTGAAETATPERAGVFQPDGATTIDRWQAGCRLLALKIRTTDLERHLEHMLGRSVGAPVRFAAGFDVSRGPGLSWARLVRAAVRDVQEAGGLLHQPLVSAPLQEALLGGLLLAADHPYREELSRPPTPSYRPAPVKRALDAIQSCPEHPFDTAELAAVARVSVRWLQEGFRRHVGMSPMAYLRDVRLNRVRDELRRAGPGELSVGEVAYRWGFVHLGRFARSYRERFGETPSQTLQAP
ncbi:AraC family transcriptional regulator [Streptomyces rimosus]|uniref:AraC family transcriptional regulator n=1 Tax=Streptomyces rimosus TaxID=1927 RepID=UPI001F36DEA6|nr:AraC family transcriptional regulator [Streptomyces rimosus]